MSIGTALALPCAVELRNLSKKDQIRDLIQKDKQGFILKYRRMEGLRSTRSENRYREWVICLLETSKHLTPQEKRQLEWQSLSRHCSKIE